VSSLLSPAPSTGREPQPAVIQPRVRQRAPLVRDTLRVHRVGAATWIVAGGLTMFGMGAAVATEMADFPGGSQALAASVAAGAEAMRLLRWPAERLDTLGGYVTYHNVILFNVLLAVYGVIQGARDIRGGEERGTLEEVLATGHARSAVVRDRAVGFTLLAAVIGLGLGLGVEAGLAFGDASDLGGALITMGTCALLAVVGYALGMLVSQVVGSARAASGIGAAVMCGLYLATNAVDSLGPAAPFVRLVSPFHHANASRALVPGYGFDPLATAALVGMAVVMFALAAWAFQRRDYAAPLWVRRVGAARSDDAAIGPVTVPHRMLGSVAAATVRRGWVGMAVWSGCTAAFVWMFAALQPAVMDVWSEFDFLDAMTGAIGTTSAEDAYWSYIGEFVTPVIAAYVITQASGWVADLAQGRVEIALSGPVTWTMLVRGRLVATTAGVAAILAATVMGLVIGATAVGSSIDPVGISRMVAMGLLFGVALAAVAAIAVAVVRRPVVVTVLAVLVGASYLVAFLVPMFGWPDWLNRMSVFWAFGHPYLRVPTASGLAVLIVLAVVGSMAATALAERTPKVP
jgi:ABC-2 type transport system permease protein